MTWPWVAIVEEKLDADERERERVKKKKIALLLDLISSCPRWAGWLFRYLHLKSLQI